VIHAAAPDGVPARTLYRILRLRSEVFVVEQECAFLDLDGRDLEARVEDGIAHVPLRLHRPG